MSTGRKADGTTAGVKRTHDETDDAAPSSKRARTMPIQLNGASAGPTNGAATGTLDGSVASVSSTAPARSATLPSGLDRQELVRLTMQCLTDAGYPQAARALAAESGYQLEREEVVQLRAAVRDGNWPEAERLALVVHPDPRDASALRFIIGTQRYLEQLEAGQTKRALATLRNDLAPLQHDPERLHVLSSLMMCKDAEDLRTRAEWDGVAGESREQLLDDLQCASPRRRGRADCSAFIPPGVMLPSHRLETLLQQAQDHQRIRCLYHTADAGSASLFVDHECSRDAFPTSCSHVLAQHQDEVWALAFSHAGAYLATASKDRTVILWAIAHGGRDFSASKLLTGHVDGVTSLAWRPDDRVLLSAADDTIKVWEVETGACLHTLTKHEYSVSALCWLPDGQSFVSAGMDCKLIFWSAEGQLQYILRTGPIRLADAAMSPDGKRLIAIGRTEPAVEASAESKANGSSFHGENRIIVYNLAERRQERVMAVRKEMTCVSVSADGAQVLVNQSPNEVCVYDLERASLVRSLIGQHQGTFIIRSCFGGDDENFVISGSEDAKVYVWHRATAALVEVATGHEAGSVNAVAWRRSNREIDGVDARPLFASASDDRTVRIWQSAEHAIEAGAAAAAAR